MVLLMIQGHIISWSTYKLDCCSVRFQLKARVLSMGKHTWIHYIPYGEVWILLMSHWWDLSQSLTAKLNWLERCVPTYKFITMGEGKNEFVWTTRTLWHICLCQYNIDLFMHVLLSCKTYTYLHYFLAFLFFC